MAGKSAAIAFGFVAAAAVGAVAWGILRQREAEPAPPSGPTMGIEDSPGKTPPPPAKGGKKRPPRGKAEPIPEEPGFAADRASCLEFLKRHASVFVPPPGAGAVPIPIGLRAAALEALHSVDPASAEPLVLAALSGDGVADSFDDDRLAAAALRIGAGKPDGAETVRAYVKAGDFTDDYAVAAAAAAAARMPAEEGARAVAALFGGGFRDYAEEAQMAILQAAAALGKGVPADELRAILANKDDAYEDRVLGAAAGALRRLGDDSGKRLVEKIEDLDWAEEFLQGLGTRGNESVAPWLEGLLRHEDSDVRAGAARALGEVGAKGAAAALKAALGDEDEFVRGEAAVALLALGDAAGLPGARAATKSRDPDLQAMAWRALALAGDAESKAAAVALLASACPGPGDGRRGQALLPRVWAARLVAAVP